MNIEDQTQEFINRLQAKYPNASRSIAKGASNGAFMLGGGFRFGLYNIDTIDFGGTKPVILATRVILPPENVLHLALVIEGQRLVPFGARRDDIRRSLGPDGKANKVRVYLTPSGVYLLQGGDESTIDPTTQDLGPSLSVSQALFSDINHETDLDPVETAYVRHLTSLLGATPVSRLAAQGGIAGGAAINPSSIAFDQLVQQINRLGAHYDRSLIERYHVALNHLKRKHLVLLTGISGTGKTLLARAYGHAILGIPSLDLPADDFHLIPVRPDWTEPTHLLGYFDAISGKYRETTFLRALLRAHRNPHRPTFVCLDEMNLAQPEHYFADALSAMETGGTIQLHHEDQDIGGVPPKLPWPDNLFITGTVNMDETTRPFSPKVLDRANVIDMSTVNIPNYLRELVARSPELASVLDEATSALLSKLVDCLAPHRMHFGYRVVKELALFVHYAKDRALLPSALDAQIEQKILTKLRGGPEQKAMLTELRGILKDLPASKTVVDRMITDLGNYESFQY